MTRKIFALLLAVVFVVVATSVASAQDAGQVAAPEAVVVQAVAPCATCGVYNGFNPCCAPACPPPVMYRRGLFGCVRPVVVAPYCYPAPRYYYRGWYRGCCW